MPRPYIEIELDKTRRLRFRHNDLADLEVASGKGLAELMGGMSFQAIRMLLSYGLRWKDTQMTPFRAGDLIDVWIENGGTLESLTEKILDALRASGFLADKKAPEEPEGDQGNALPGATTP